MDQLVLYSTLYGSHLYGTNTPTSDLDIKRIVLPPLNDLLMCKQVGNKVVKTNTLAHTKNTAEDVDQEDIPLQVFIKDFVEGQTYALELAFSMDGDHAQQQFYNSTGKPIDKARAGLYELVRQLRSQFLTNNVKAMMGYVFNQANLYSFKGERLNCAREFEEILALAYSQLDPQTSLGDILAKPLWLASVQRLEAKYSKYVRLSEYDIGGNRMRPCVALLEKTFPFTNTLEHSLEVVKTIINKYGSRANAASQDNVDWKAMMHAVRIIDEGLELLEHKKITLPRPAESVTRLLQIKRGELQLEPLKDELVQKLERLKDIMTTCGLRSSAEPQFKVKLEQFTIEWLRAFYRLT